MSDLSFKLLLFAFQFSMGIIFFIDINKTPVLAAMKNIIQITRAGTGTGVPFF
jgi:hypothetical protein